ncbi:hypothetical protein F5Y19DRAFT_376847 [Xylariaceae sp. FL1651]|nr:hypothetical protein F5Y19DRAFT_376847 [Xylariaceae sp. FL1651]
MGQASKKGGLITAPSIVTKLGWLPPNLQQRTCATTILSRRESDVLLFISPANKVFESLLPYAFRRYSDMMSYAPASFNDLPTEIRLMIWEAVIRPTADTCSFIWRVQAFHEPKRHRMARWSIELNSGADLKGYKEFRLPPTITLAQLTRESREHVRDRLRLPKPTIPGPSHRFNDKRFRVITDPEHDMFIIDSWIRHRRCPFLDQNEPSESIPSAHDDGTEIPLLESCHISDVKKVLLLLDNFQRFWFSFNQGTLGLSSLEKVFIICEHDRSNGPRPSTCLKGIPQEYIRRLLNGESAGAMNRYQKMRYVNEADGIIEVVTTRREAWRPIHPYSQADPGSFGVAWHRLGQSGISCVFICVELGSSYDSHIWRWPPSDE